MTKICGCGCGKSHDESTKSCLSCKQRAKIYRESYYRKNKSKIIQQSKDYQKEDRKRTYSYTKKWNENNDWFKIHTNRQKRERWKTDINFKLACTLRSRLTLALRGKTKSGSAVRDLGCSIPFLELWLEAQFKPGMTWENHGKNKNQWSIDHIYPLSKVDLTDREQLLKVCNYENLQPLWSSDNIKKNNKT